MPTETPSAKSTLNSSVLRLRTDGGEHLLQEVYRALSYYGYNRRPDAPTDHCLTFALGSVEIPFSVAEKQPFFLESVFDETLGKEEFHTVPGPSALSVTPHLEGESVLLEIAITPSESSPKGRKLTREFTISPTKKRDNHYSGSSSTWSLNGEHVNMTTLLRQRCRWIGRDLFLEQHGGEEFAGDVDRECLLFGAGETLYRCYLSVGEYLVWSGDRWVAPCHEESEKALPLLQLTDLSPDMASITLWDPHGVAPVEVSVDLRLGVESPDHLVRQLNIQGIKTMQQAIVELNQERVILECGDWFLYEGVGWHKLEESDQIEAYVDGKWSGHLLVVDRIAIEEGRQVLMGHMFNPARNHVKQVKLELQKGNEGDEFYPETLMDHGYFGAAEDPYHFIDSQELPLVVLERIA